MKIVKLTKSMLKLSPGELLIKIGAVRGNMGYPGNVYISREDAKELKKNLRISFKKIYPNINKTKLDNAVALEWLNYSPNESLELAIKPGYLIVDSHDFIV